MDKCVCHRIFFCFDDNLGGVPKKEFLLEGLFLDPLPYDNRYLLKVPAHAEEREERTSVPVRGMVRQPLKFI